MDTENRKLELLNVAIKNLREENQNRNYNEQVVHSQQLVCELKGKKGEEAKQEIIKEIKKLKRQNTVTHCLVSAMIFLTLAWQVSEVSAVLIVKDGLSHPFKSLGGFYWMFIGPQKKEKIEASSPLAFPELSDLSINEFY